MARARNIKPGFFKNEYLGELDPYARLLFIGLWMLADREGRLEDRPLRIKAEVFPYESVQVEKLLDKLDMCGGDLIQRYEVDGERYIQITNFSQHQNPHKNEKGSCIPAFDKNNRVMARSTREKASLDPAESLLLNPESLLLNPLKSIEEKRKRFVPPTLNEIKTYCMERENSIDPQHFLDHYEANGWMRGSTKIKDWKACMRTWEQRDKAGGKSNGRNAGAHNEIEIPDDIFYQGD